MLAIVLVGRIALVYVSVRADYDVAEESDTAARSANMSSLSLIFFPTCLSSSQRGDDRESCKEEMLEERADVAKQERLGSRASAAYELQHSFVTCHVNHP